MWGAVSYERGTPVQGLGFRDRAQAAPLEFGVLSRGGVGQNSGFRFQGSGFRFQVSGFRFQVSGSRIQGSGFRGQGSGCRVLVEPG